MRWERSTAAVRPPLKAMPIAASTAGAARARVIHFLDDRAGQPQGFAGDLSHWHLPRIHLAPLPAHGDEHDQRKRADFGEGKRVDAIADAAALHQQHAALAAEPGAGKNANSLFLGREHRRVDVRLMAKLDQPGVPGVRNVDHLFDIGFAQFLKDLVRPRGRRFAAVVSPRLVECLRGHLTPRPQAENFGLRFSLKAAMPSL